MTEASSPTRLSEWVDLAREADFALGEARIRPSLSEVVTDGRNIRLQPRIMQVLVALARANGEVVSRDALVASCWGGLSVGEDAINRCIGRLRRLAVVETPGAFGIETLARIGYRLNRLDGPEHPTATTARLRRPPIWLMAAIVVGLAVMAGAAWVVFGHPAASANGGGRVALASFQTAGEGELARAFATGVSDEVASALAKNDLEPISSDTISGGSGPQREAAAGRLGAAFLLDGRVHLAGDRLELKAHLTDIRRHTILWSADYERPAANSQAMQEEAAAQIAYVLHCAFDAGNFQGGQIDGQTLSLYLRACDVSRDADDPTTVRHLFKEVVQREPRFAPAWARLAEAIAAESVYLPADEAPASLREGEAAAHEALELDPKDGTAYLALADLVPTTGHWSQGGHWLERYALLQKGLSLKPDDPELDLRESEFLMAVGRMEDALVFADRAASLDPLSPHKAANLASALAFSGRPSAGLATIERAARIWPDDDEVRGALMGIEARQGDPDKALALIDDPNRRPTDMEPDELVAWRTMILSRKHDNPSETAALVTGEIARLDSKGFSVGQSVLKLATLGKTDEAFAVAARSTPNDNLEGDTDMLFRPYADSMRRDPRFMPLVASLGLVDFWRRTGKWPDFCEARDRPYDCRAVATALAVRR